MSVKKKIPYNLSKKKSGDYNYQWALTLVTSLFFMWGLSYGLLDVLNKHFQITLNVSRAQSGLLQLAYFGAYFIVAIPAGILIQRKGYLAGIILGLLLYASGALIFVPATIVGNFRMFLLAIFVIACGLGCLETSANPLAAVLGKKDESERRLNMAQSFNGLGQFVGPLIGGVLFFAHDQTNAQQTVQFTYIVIAVLVLFIALLFSRISLPFVQNKKDENTEVGKPLFKNYRFMGAVTAQFFYIAAQVGIGAFFINYITEQWGSVSNSSASYLLSLAMICFMVGRFISTWLMTYIKPSTLLVCYSAINIFLSLLIVFTVTKIAIIAIFFFMSIMFPTIFAMGIKSTGSNTKIASSIMIMSVVGGGIMPWFMGLVADITNIAFSYLLPMFCFVIVLIYAVWYRQKN